MRSHRLRPLAGRLALAALVATAALSAGCFNPFQPLVSSRTTHVEPPPAPTGPREVVLLFKWCWENRDITNYREIFTDDYRFAFALTDSAGNFYRTTPWTREDELTSAQNLFVGGSATEPAASSITLIFDGDLVALPDYRDGKTAAVHQYIQISNLTLTVNRTDGSAYRVTGGAAFFLVRGDSAVIPQELKDRGFGPDKNRWYMERWEDQTNGGAGGAMAGPAGGLRAGLPASGAAPTQTTRDQLVTWGRLKQLFLPPLAAGQP
jgi:hypothetical protein